MNKFFVFLFTAFAFVLTTGFVRSVIVNFDSLPKTDKWSLQEPEDRKKVLKTTKDDLARAAISESIQDYENCAKSAKKVPVKSIVKDWAEILEITCATQLADPDLKSNNKSKIGATYLEEVLKRVDVKKTGLNKASSEKRENAILNGRLVLCRNFKKHARWKDLRSQLQKAFASELDYDKNERAELYEMAGEVLVAERQWTEALNQLQRSWELNPDSDQTDSKIRAILPLVPPSAREQFEGRMKAAIPPAMATVAPSSDEAEMASQADIFISRNDPVSAAEALSKLIHKFPGGIKAKWAQDKIFELLNAEVEKSKGPNGPSIAKKKILSLMADFDVDRQYDWGKSLFDIQLYGDAGPLLKRAADQVSGSTKSAKMYYLAGRAFQLSNDYSKAKDMFQLILKKYPASPEVVDAAIQWALINVNENDPSEAITHLEVARSRHLTNQQDLVSLFWLYQSYKAKNTEVGITQTGADLIKRFGLTYYGIITYQDLNRSLPQFMKGKSRSGKVFFSAQETQALEKAKVLIGSGLFNAAADELSIFSTRPLSQDEQEYLLGFYIQSVHHQKAFSIISGIFDEAPEKKTDVMVKKLFPKEFWELVSSDKMRADLDPFLILSVMKQESAFDQNAVSRSGALGLLQMIPPTAQEVKQELHSDEDMPKGLTDPATNVRYCAYYLARLIKKFNGSIPLALAAYNAGPTRIVQFINAKGGGVRDTWVDELPWAETSFYVKSILKNYLMYRILYGGLTQLPVPPWSVPVPQAGISPLASPSAKSK